MEKWQVCHSHSFKCCTKNHKQLSRDSKNAMRPVELSDTVLARIIPWAKRVGGYSPWGCKELGMTECTRTALNTLIPI